MLIFRNGSLNILALWLIETVNNFSRSTSFNQWALNVESPRFFSIATPIALNVHHSSRLFPVLILIGALISFIIVLGGGYMYILPSLSQAFLGHGVLKFNNSSNVCNVFDGSWVIVEGEKKKENQRNSSWNWIRPWISCKYNFIYVFTFYTSFYYVIYYYDFLDMF